MKKFKKFCAYGVIFSCALFVQMGAKTTAVNAATDDINVHTESRGSEVVHNLSLKKGTSTTSTYEFKSSLGTVKSQTWSSDNSDIVAITSSTSKKCTINAKAEGVAVISLKVTTTSGKSYTEKFSVSSFTDLEDTKGLINTEETPFRRGATATKFEAESIRKYFAKGTKVTIKAKCKDYYYVVASDGTKGYTYCQKTTALISSFVFKDSKGNTISTNKDYKLNRGLSITVEPKPSYADEGFKLTTDDKRIVSVSSNTAKYVKDGETNIFVYANKGDAQDNLYVETNTDATATGSSTTNRTNKQTYTFTFESDNQNIVAYEFKTTNPNATNANKFVKYSVTPAKKVTVSREITDSYRFYFHAVLADGSVSEDYNFQYHWLYFRNSQNGSFVVSGNLDNTLWPEKTQIILPVVDTTAEPRKFVGWVTEENSAAIIGGYRWSKITKNTTFYGRWLDVDYNPFEDVANLQDEDKKVLDTRVENASDTELKIDVRNFYSQNGYEEIKGIYVGKNKNYWENTYYTTSKKTPYPAFVISSFTVPVTENGTYYICVVDKYGNTQIRTSKECVVTINVDGNKEYKYFKSGSSLYKNNLSEPQKDGCIFVNWSRSKNGKDVFESSNSVVINDNITLYAVFVKNSYTYADFRFGFDNFGCDEKNKYGEKNAGHCSEFATLGIAFAYGLGYNVSQYNKSSLGELKLTDSYNGVTIKKCICDYRHNGGNILIDKIPSLEYKGISAKERKEMTSTEYKSVLKQNLNGIVDYFNNNKLPLYMSISWGDIKTEKKTVVETNKQETVTTDEHCHAVVAYGMKIKNNQAHIYLADSNFFESGTKTELIVYLNESGKATGVWEYNDHSTIYETCNSTSSPKGIITAYTVDPKSCYR